MVVIPFPTREEMAHRQHPEPNTTVWRCRCCGTKIFIMSPVGPVCTKCGDVCNDWSG